MKSASQPHQKTAASEKDRLLHPLEREWQRGAMLVTLAEARRTGRELDQDFVSALEVLSEQVGEDRAAGSWRALVRLASQDTLGALSGFHLDILMLALLGDSHPALAPRLAALQSPGLGAAPSLALLQDLMMLTSAVEVEALYQALEPAGPLLAADLLRVEDTAGHYTVRAPGRVVQALLGRPRALGAPPGAHAVTGDVAWERLIVPEATRHTLQDFVNWIELGHAQPAGAAGGYGPVALFCGPSGTGKTLAAQVLRTAISAQTKEPWALYSVDLGRVLSKYIGETEKNLNALLDAMDGRRAILQIDEADGLLGKRGDVADARDRYANLEVSHLLSRLERHRGPVILTTNLKTNLDRAFMRRFQLVVDFPAPDPVARRRLWQRLLPDGYALSPDVDLRALGEGVRLSGGAIRNAAHYAGVLASAEIGAAAVPHIQARHLARAVRAELAKEQRELRPVDLGPLAPHFDTSDGSESGGPS